MPKFLNEKVACGTTCIQIPEDKLFFSKGCKAEFRKDKKLKFRKEIVSGICCDIIQENPSIPTATPADPSSRQVFVWIESANVNTATVNPGDVISTPGIYRRATNGALTLVYDDTAGTIVDFDVWDDGQKLVIYHSTYLLKKYDYDGTNEATVFDNSGSATTPRPFQIMRQTASLGNKAYLYYSTSSLNWEIREIDLSTSSKTATLTGVLGITTSGDRVLSSEDRIWSNVYLSSIWGIATWAGGSSSGAEKHSGANVGNVGDYVRITEMIHDISNNLIYAKMQASGGAGYTYYGSLPDYDVAQQPFDFNDVTFYSNPSSFNYVFDYDLRIVYMGNYGALGILYMESPSDVGNFGELPILHNGDLLYSGEHGVSVTKTVPIVNP